MLSRDKYAYCEGDVRHAYPFAYVLGESRESSPSCHRAARLRPGKLWSLWDLMHKLRADVFFKAFEQACVFHQMLAMLPDRKPPAPLAGYGGI